MAQYREYTVLRGYYYDNVDLKQQFVIVKHGTRKKIKFLVRYVRGELETDKEYSNRVRREIMDELVEKLGPYIASSIADQFINTLLYNERY